MVYCPPILPEVTHMTIRPAALFFCMMLLSASLMAQKQAPPKQATNLRSDPSTHNPAIQTLPKGTSVVLVAPQPTNGFYHVRTADKKEGWVWGANVSTGAHQAKASRKLAHPPAVVESGPEERGAVACAGDLNSCSSSGCSPAHSPPGLANQVKRASHGERT